MTSTGVSFPDGLMERVDDERHSTTPRSQWLQDSARMRLEIERAAEAAAVDTDDLPEGWWQEFLYEATRGHLRERRERELADEEEREGIEAD
jgi:hypothetical protein